MPLSVLLPLVVLGIAGIVLLVLWLRPTPPLVMTEDSALEIWNHRNPLAPADRVDLHPTGRFALVHTPAGPGLVWAMGADPVTRLLQPPPRVRTTPRALKLKLQDVTASAVTIPFDDPATRDRWLALLTPPDTPPAEETAT